MHFAVGVTVMDSGNYTCEIRTPEGNILGGVTHSLFVRGKSNLQCLLFSSAYAAVVFLFYSDVVASYFFVQLLSLVIGSNCRARHFFTARVILCYGCVSVCIRVSVCLCVCLSQDEVLLKWLNTGTCKQCHTITQGVS